MNNEFKTRLLQLAGEIKGTYSLIDATTGAGTKYSPSAWIDDEGPMGASNALLPAEVVAWLETVPWDDRKASKARRPDNASNVASAGLATTSWGGIDHVNMAIIDDEDGTRIGFGASINMDMHETDFMDAVLSVHEALHKYEAGRLDTTVDALLSSVHDAKVSPVDATIAAKNGMKIKGDADGSDDAPEGFDDVETPSNSLSKWVPIKDTGKEIDTTSTDTNDIVAKKIIQSRFLTIIKHPFYGTIIAQLKWREADDPRIKKCATDGQTVWINRDYFEKLSLGETTFVLMHEVFHVIFDHVGGWRGRSLDHEKWAAAQDYVINGILDAEGIGKMPEGKYKGYLNRHEYDNMFAEEVYAKLKEQYPEDAPTNADGTPMMVPGSGEMDGNGMPIPGTGEPMPGGFGKSSEGKDGDLLDDHGIFDDMPESEKRARDEAVGDMIRQAHLNAAGSIGSPLMEKMINDFLDPVMDWRTMIHKTIESLRRDNWTFRKLGKKSNISDIPEHELGLSDEELEKLTDEQKAELRKEHGTRFPYPSMTLGEKAEITIAIDTSGSISPEQVTEMLSEVAAITMQIEEWSIEIMQFDTTVFGHETFSSENQDDKHSIADYAKRVKGGGGTEFMVVWDYMKEKKIKPKQLIFFTDGLPWDSWGDPNYCPTTFIIHGNPRIEAPFGRTAWYND